ncbi:MAG: antitoxin HicB [Brachybacterium tyrofermentans]|uniref:antitoxin HicB n=1 Tax=Brachybacterium tyrofermentans TaxID=47848 RepID=UPI003FB647E3
MSAVTVVATRWTQGWELTLEGEEDAATQVRTLDKARQQIVDYLDTVDPEVDHADWVVTVIPADETDAQKIRAVREGTAAAAIAQEEAARSTRNLIADLDKKQYKSADIAGLLGISRGRVSQLLSESRTA